MHNDLRTPALSMVMSAALTLTVIVGNNAQAAEELAASEGSPKANIYSSLVGAEFLPGADQLIVGQAFIQRGVYRYDLTSGQVLGKLASSDRHQLTGISVAADGSVIVASYLDHTILVWDAGSGTLQTTLVDTEIASMPANDDRPIMSAVVVNDDGRLVAVRYHDGNIRIFDVETAATGPLIDSQSYADDVAFVPGKDTFVTIGEVASEWDASTGDLVRTFKVASDWTDVVAVAPDGMSGASNDNDELIVWDMAGGEEVFRFDDLELGISALAFSPDGGMVAAGDVYGTVALWDMNTGQRVGRFSMENESPIGIDFSPDGRWIAVSHLLGALEIWSVDRQRRIVSAAIADDGWASWTPDFAFVTSPGYAHEMFGSYDEKTNTSTSDDRFLDHLARPDLVAKALAEN